MPIKRSAALFIAAAIACAAPSGPADIMAVGKITVAVRPPGR